MLAEAAPSQTSSISQCRHCGFQVRVKKAVQGESLFCCYGCVFAHQILEGGTDGKPTAWILVKLGIAVFLAMNVMGFALAMHASSIYPDYYIRLSDSGRVFDELLRYLLLFLSAPVMFLIGVPLYENMIRELRAGRWGVEGFIGMSVLGAFGYSLVSTLRGHGAVYYDVAVMVLVFLTLGRYLEAKFRGKAASSLERVLQDTPNMACLWLPEGETTVPSESLRAQDQVILRAGSRVPADGFILEGTGVLDMAPMTGEFVPVKKTIGDAIWSGALLTEGFLKIRVVHSARTSWTERLKCTLMAAKQTRAPIENMADRLVGMMTWLTLILALTAFGLGAYSEGLMPGFMRALSVLVIVCPCALGAAVPLALWKSFEAIVERGILFKDLGRLEVLAKIRGVFLDKTGTLTEPLPVLETVRVFEKNPESEVLRAAASVAQASAHPLSRSLVLSAQKQLLSLEYARDVLTQTGEGLSGEIPGYGRVWLGSRKYLEANGFSVPEQTAAQLRVYVGWHQQVRGLFAFKEALRNSSAAFIEKLKASQLQVMVLTGDSEESARALEKELKVSVIAEMTPGGKHDYVRRWETKWGPSLSVGEGLNDAPMLAGAGVSLAVSAALDQTRDAADFVLPDNNLEQVSWLIENARRTMRRIHLNLFWAFFYNGLAIPLAMTGKINPVIAAFAMILSSVFIIVQSMRK